MSYVTNMFFQCHKLINVKPQRPHTLLVEYQYVKHIHFSFKVVPYISVGWRWTIKTWNPDSYEQWEKDEMAWRKFLINGAFDARGLPIYQMTSKGLSNGMYWNTNGYNPKLV